MSYQLDRFEKDQLNTIQHAMSNLDIDITESSIHLSRTEYTLKIRFPTNNTSFDDSDRLSEIIKALNSRLNRLS